MVLTFVDTTTSTDVLADTDPVVLSAYNPITGSGGPVNCSLGFTFTGLVTLTAGDVIQPHLVYSTSSSSATTVGQIILTFLGSG